jgi:hypothetical protein
MWVKWKFIWYRLMIIAGYEGLSARVSELARNIEVSDKGK